MRSSLLVVVTLISLGTCQHAMGAEGTQAALPRIIRTIELSQLNFTRAANLARAAFGKDGQILIATSMGEIWDVRIENLAGNKLAHSERPTHFHVASQPSARRVLFCDYNGECVSISTDAGEVYKWTAQMRYPEALAISPNGNLFAIAESTTVVVRKLSDRSLIGRHESNRMIEDVAFSADSNLLAVTKHDGVDIVLANQPEKAVSTILNRRIPRVISFVGNGDAERLCIEAYGGSNNGRSISFYDSRNWHQDGDSLTLDKDNGNSIGMTKSPGGEWLMISTNAHRHYDRIRSGLWFLNVHERKLHAPDSEPDSMIMSVDFSADGKLALDQCDKTIRIWQMPERSK